MRYIIKVAGAKPSKERSAPIMNSQNNRVHFGERNGYFIFLYAESKTRYIIKKYVRKNPTKINKSSILSTPILGAD